MLFVYFPLTSAYIDQLLPGQEVKEAFSLKLQTQSNLIFNNKIKWNFPPECSKITLNIYFFLFILKHTPTNYTKITIHAQKLNLTALHKRLNKTFWNFFLQVISWKGLCQEKIGLLNFLLSLIKPIEDLIILRFVYLVTPSLPNNNTQTTSCSLISRIFRLSIIVLRSPKCPFL